MTIAGTYIIKPLKKPEVTKSGIFLPGSMTEEINRGEILFVGAGKAKNQPEVSVGDQVVFLHKSYKLRRFELEGDGVIRCNFEDILLIDKQ